MRFSVADQQTLDQIRYFRWFRLFSLIFHQLIIHQKLVLSNAISGKSAGNLKHFVKTEIYCNNSRPTFLNSPIRPGLWSLASLFNLSLSPTPPTTVLNFFPISQIFIYFMVFLFIISFYCYCHLFLLLYRCIN